MKIRIHKRFRGLLSLLVAVMLLVGVMPLSSVTVHAWSKQVTVYFAKRMGSAAIDGGDNTGIGFWGAEEGSEAYTRKKMNYVSNSKENTGYWIYTYTVKFTKQSDYGLKFIEGGPDGDEGAGTVDIKGDDLIDGYLYYTKGTQGGKHLVEKMPFSDAYYKPLTTSDTFRATKDMNVIVDSSGTFKQDAERHYVKATMYDYFSDYEIINGTTRTGGNQNNAVNAGITTATMYRSWEDPLKRIHTLTFDKALSAVYGNNSYQHPLYFGDIHHEGNGYKFGKSGSNAGDDGVNEGQYWQLVRGSSYNQLYHDNNSKRRSGLTDTDESASPFSAAMGLYSQMLGSYTAKPAAGETQAQKETRMNNNAKRLTLIGGGDAKWFDTSWLESGNSMTKMIGTSYNVDFPFWTLENLSRKITIDGTEYTRTGDYYYINSENASHALRLHKDTSGQYYLKETGEGVYNFSGNDTDVINAAENVGKTDEELLALINTPYGFFPFNSKQDFYTGGNTSTIRNLMDYRLRFDRTNYCFGTYMEIPFTLTNNNGTVDGDTLEQGGTPITFTFSGDDDLLVYIDGNLVLDIGGDHGKVQGEINLQQKKSWVSQAKTSNGSGEATGVTWAAPETGAVNKIQNITIPSSITNSSGVKDLSNMTKVGDSTKKICDKGEHVMEIFYVERGLFDSNMEIMYNLPVKEERSFTVEEHIDTTTGVNDVFKNDSTFSTNASNLKLQIDVQFSKPTNGNDFTQLLESQDYPGDYPNKYTFTSTLYQNYFGTSDSVYTAKMGNSQTLTYVNDFIKPYDYNLKVSQNNSKIFIGDADTGKTVNSLFTTTWTLAKYGSNSNENTGGGSGAGPVHTTSSSSRPARGIKTTSTSANNDTSFDFRGTTQNPDAIVFNNTMQTADLTINKTITNRKSSDVGQPVTFTFRVTFDDVGGIALEDVRNATTGSVETNRQIVVNNITVEVPANSNTGSTLIEDIPLHTKYKIEEIGTNDYTPTYSDNIDNTYHTLEADDSAHVSNSYTDPAVLPVQITLQIQKIWADDENEPNQADVNFILEKKVGSGNFEPLVISGVTDANGVFNMGSAVRSTTGPNNQIVVWTLAISNENHLIQDKAGNGDSITYRIRECVSGGTTPITQTGTPYDENWITNYTFALDNDTIETQNEKPGTQKDGSNHLLLSVKNSHPASNPTNPETGGRGGYIPIAGGFIAILLAGAGYFIYKKRIFA